MIKRSDLCVVIVSFNTAKLTAHAIHSVLSQKDVEVIVVDNNSSDQTVKLLQKEFGSKIGLIENTENVGFARANNQGVQQASGNYVMLLNSDTIVHPGALHTLRSVLEKHPEIGAVAACLQNPDGSFQPQGGALPTLLNVSAWWLWPLPGIFPGVVPYQDLREVTGEGIVKRGWVGGTAVMFRKSEYLRLGGLDEKIFMYAEDVDLCLRLQKNGLQVAIAPKARVTHLGMQSGSSAKARLGEVRGVLYLFSKYYSGVEVVLVRCVLVVGSLLRFFLFGILKGNKNARELYLRTLIVCLH